MDNLMIDIETLGTKPSCVILSISAVSFDLKTGRIGDVFHQNISVEDSVKQGLKIDEKTFFWWLNQSKEAQQKIIDLSDQHKLKNTLIRFYQFVYNYTSNDVKVWGNSARFDLGILEAAFDLFDFELPWEHYNERDVRTLVAFAPEIKEEQEFDGVPHYGIDDCKHQIKYCSKIFNKLNIAENPNT
ncbi:3'-5' exonuclease [Tenacibaculum mesophilum]|uniref:3'-5' exonuclease n=1 Tax=Tenacibaculum mesophilum TaxID=104268 RepID=UPI00064B5AE7|nr:3'-5' exonuclease [Tenacibaculum mesophilum]